MKEKQKKELKDLSDFKVSEKMVNLAVNKEQEIFQDMEVVYCFDLKNYVQIKKFDQEKKTYDVRIVEPSEE